MIALGLFAVAGFLIFAAGFVMGTAYGVDQESQRNEEVQRWMRKLRREGVIGDGDYHDRIPSVEKLPPGLHVSRSMRVVRFEDEEGDR